MIKVPRGSDCGGGRALNKVGNGTQINYLFVGKKLERSTLQVYSFVVNCCLIQNKIFIIIIYIASK